MRRTPFAMMAVLAFGLVTVAAGVVPSPEIGQPAPAFRLPDTRGAQHSLAQYRGKWVVLEWSNYGCPYVQKHYNSGTSRGSSRSGGTGASSGWRSCLRPPGSRATMRPRR